MSTLLLSLLLLLLVAMGLLMGRTVAEHFTDAPAAVPQMSPALANLLATPALVASLQKPAPSVDKLARDKEITQAAEEVAHSPPPSPPGPGPAPAPSNCPACPVCPDMSQYIRLDEVPCWNCTLP